MFEYDESAFRQRVAGLVGSQRALLAASCAERLMSTYEWIIDTEGSGDTHIVRNALDLAWVTEPPTRLLEQAIMNIQQLVPDEDDVHVPVAYALVQNTIAAVIYALRAKASNDAQDVVWAARQLYEAADFVVQREAPNQTYIDDLRRHAPVQHVLRGLASSLDELGSASLVELRRAARADGDALLAFFKGG